MKNTRPLRWGKRALAALLCFGMAFSVPAGSALAEQTPTPTPAAQTAEPTPEPTASTPPGTMPEGALGVQEAAPSPHTGAHALRYADPHGQPRAGTDAFANGGYRYAGPRRCAGANPDAHPAPAGANHAC